MLHCASSVPNVDTPPLSLQLTVHISQYRDGVESMLTFSLSESPRESYILGLAPNGSQSRPSLQLSQRLALLCLARQFRTAEGCVDLLKLQRLLSSFSYMAIPS